MNRLIPFITMCFVLVGCGESHVRLLDHDRTRTNPWVGWYVTEPDQWKPEQGYVSATFFGGRLEWTITDRENPSLRWMATGRFIPGADRMRGTWTCQSTAVYRLEKGRGKLLYQRMADGSGGARSEGALVKTFLETSEILATALPKAVVECGGEVELTREVSEESRLRIVVQGADTSHNLLFHGADSFQTALDSLGEPAGVLVPWRHQSLYQGTQTLFPAPSNEWLPNAQGKRFYATPNWEVEDDGENWVLRGVVGSAPDHRSFRKPPSHFFREMVSRGRWHMLVPQTDVQSGITPSIVDGNARFVIPKNGSGFRATIRFEQAFPANQQVEQDVSLEEDGTVRVGETRLLPPSS